MTPDRDSPSPSTSRFRATFLRVLLVQIVVLTLLGLIQILYNV